RPPPLQARRPSSLAIVPLSSVSKPLPAEAPYHATLVAATASTLIRVKPSPPGALRRPDASLRLAPETFLHAGETHDTAPSPRLRRGTGQSGQDRLQGPRRDPCRGYLPGLRQRLWRLEGGGAAHGGRRPHALLHRPHPPPPGRGDRGRSDRRTRQLNQRGNGAFARPCALSSCRAP